MQSAQLSVFPGIQTFSFVGATYSSRYVAFTGVELYSDAVDAHGAFTRIATLSPRQQALVEPLRHGRRSRTGRTGAYPVRRHRQPDGHVDLGVQPGGPGRSSPRRPSPVA